MTRRAAFPALLLVTIATLGCDVIQAPDLPIPCVQEFSDAHCLAIVDTVGVKLDLTRADIVAVAILPSESKGMTLGGAAPVSVRVTLVDGSTRDVSIGCGGLAMAPACSDDPHLEPASIILGGYHDVPCAGEPPAGCATPVPPPDPAGLAAAVELQLDRFDIPIDHVGDYDVPLGEARLPNGLLTVADFAFADRWPADVTILEGRAWLEIRSLEPGGRPFGNIYDHGRSEGAERVVASLVFHVDRFDPGAVLSIRDVIVR